jgi:hypothetical protein
MVPEVGLEPTRRLDPRGILSPVRLPIPPLRHQVVAQLPVLSGHHPREQDHKHTSIGIQRQDRLVKLPYHPAHTPAKTVSALLSAPFVTSSTPQTGTV